MQSRVTFDSNHRPEPITDQTPLDQVIQMEIEAGIDTDDTDDDPKGQDMLALKSIPPDALLVLLRFIISKTSSRKRWRVAQLKLATLAHAAGMETVGNKSLTELAAELGCTRSLLSLYSTRLIDQLGINQVRGGKSRSSRETYRQNAIKIHTAAGHQITVKQKQLRQFSPM
jgi:hypothetical protein